MYKGRPQNRTPARPKGRKIKSVDFFALLFNAMAAAKNKRVGWDHADQTHDHWLAAAEYVDKYIPDTHLEDALCTANMMNEIGEYYHPLGVPLDTLISRCLKPGERFDLNYHLILEKKHDNT